MTIKEAREYIENERKCVIRSVYQGCKKDCAECSLARDGRKIIEAYDTALGVFDYANSMSELLGTIQQ